MKNIVDILLLTGFIFVGMWLVAGFMLLVRDVFKYVIGRK